MRNRRISRSSHSSYCRCPRLHYYQYRYRGTGFEEARKPLPLAIGLALHAGMEAALRAASEGTFSLEEAVLAVHKEWATQTAGWKGGQLESLEPWERDTLSSSLEEGGYLAESLLRAWVTTRMPSFLDQYEVLMVEKEVEMQLAPGLSLQARADAVVRDRLSGSVLVVNHKTTGRKDNFSVSWLSDVQMWTEAFAMQEVLGEPVHGVLVLGFYKGQQREGLHSTPLLYGYRTDDGLYSATWQRSSSSKVWRKFRAWKEPTPAGPSLADWLNWLGPAVLAESLLETPPITKNDSVVREWIKQVVQKERAIDGMLAEEVPEEDRLPFFWQNFSSMNCRWCPYRPVCFNQTSIDALLEGGYLAPRVDHHGEKGVEDVNPQ